MQTCEYDFHKIQACDMMSIIRRLPYDAFFRLCMTSKWIGKRIQGNEKFRYTLPHSVKLVIQSRGEGKAPYLIWEDYDWEPTNENSSEENERTIFERHRVFMGPFWKYCFKGFHFNRLCIESPESIQVDDRFSSTEALFEFIRDSKITCTTLHTSEMTFNKYSRVILKDLKPARMNLSCRYVRTYDFFRQPDFNLAYLYMYLPMEGFLPIVDFILGNVPSIEIRFTNHNFVKNDFIQHLKSVFRTTKELPLKRCRYIKIFYRLNSFVLAELPTKEELFPIYGHYPHFIESKAGTNFKINFVLKKETHRMVVKLTRDTCHIPEISFELDNIMNCPLELLEAQLPHPSTLKQSEQAHQQAQQQEDIIDEEEEENESDEEEEVEQEVQEMLVDVLEAVARVLNTS